MHYRLRCKISSLQGPPPRDHHYWAWAFVWNLEQVGRQYLLGRHLQPQPIPHGRGETGPSSLFHDRVKSWAPMRPVLSTPGPMLPANANRSSSADTEDFPAFTLTALQIRPYSSRRASMGLYELTKTAIIALDRTGRCMCSCRLPCERMVTIQ